jgi:hypothetical protein
MAYFALGDVRDELLKELITDADIAESTAYIDDIAMRLGVRPERIPEPPPFQIKSLAMSYALMLTALNASMNNGNGGENEADAYELKRRVYAKRVAELEAQVTVQTLLGGGSSGRKFPVAVPLRRC